LDLPQKAGLQEFGAWTWLKDTYMYLEEWKNGGMEERDRRLVVSGAPPVRWGLGVWPSSVRTQCRAYQGFRTALWRAMKLDVALT
jgi:hypothetical protein